MMKTKLEYVWLDGYTPEPQLRSKIRVFEGPIPTTLSNVPVWNFDGSSTQQAEGHFSDCVLHPVRLYAPYTSADPCPTVYVLCTVHHSDGTPHVTNTRAAVPENSDLWFGFEQEYFIRSGYQQPILGFEQVAPEPQGKYYCGVGGQMRGRHISDTHLNICLNYGLNIEGTNAEVALGQWEYQIFAADAQQAADDLWMSRYLLSKIAEAHDCHIEWHPKPLLGWNGSGLHTNFSSSRMRDIGGHTYFLEIFDAFRFRKHEHIQNYGSDNHLRLTGQYETADINTFSWGVSDRGASIRIPAATAVAWKGYLEDRRPASHADPYRVVRTIAETLQLIK